MRDVWLGRLFVRFRDKRDGKALAAVFDATARELIGVAVHLVPTADQAEDVVQTTFQRAIERAHSYDGERSLKGWLYGILWREAARLTRSELRRPDPQALTAREVFTPEEAAEARELPDSVRAALGRMSSPYREVLEPVLLEEQSAREVAAALGRSPGTVRVQLQRGLERLRRELPAVERRLSGRRAPALVGLASLRQRVLGHAGFVPGAVPAASAGFLLWQLASAALSTSVWVGAGLVGTAVVVGVARFEAPPKEERVSAPVGVARAAREANESGARVLEAPSRVGATPLPPDQEQGSVPARTSRPAGRRAPEPIVDPQVTGLVVDEADRPLADVLVVADAENHYGYADTHTDERGRFAFGDLAAGRWYVHADDEHYAEMWWQTHPVVLEEQRGGLPAPELRLVLLAAHEVRGTLLDEGGAPVPEAGITLAREWLAGAEAPLQGHLTEEVAATTTDEAGGFVFERLPAGRMTLLCEHPDFARTLAEVEAPGPPLRLTLPRGMTLDGLVLAHGAPLADVRILAQSTRLSHLTMGDWEVTSDARGGFRIEHVAPVGELRLSGVSTLTLAVHDAGWESDRLAVFETARGMLPSVTLEAFAKGERKAESVDVGRDWAGEALHAGMPYGNGAIRVRLAGSAPVDGVRVWLQGLSPELERVTANLRIEPGSDALFEHLAAGSYRLSPQNGGGVNYAPVTLALDPDEVRTVELKPGELTLSGRVTCGGEPVSSGNVSARSIRNGAGQLASGTIADGRYRIDGLVAGSYELLVSEEGALTQSFEATLGDADANVDLELAAGRIEGRLGFERAEEGADFLVAVFPYGWYAEAGNRGVFVDPGSDGRFQVRHLPPGDYVVSALRAKAPVASRVVTLSAGAPTQQVELARLTELGTLVGRVALPAASGARRSPSIAAFTREPQGLRRAGYAAVEPDGSFRAELEPGLHALLFSDFGGTLPFVWVPEVSIRAGATSELALVLPPGRAVSIRLDAGEAWTPRSIWNLVLPTGERLSFLCFIGSEPEGRRAGTSPFQLPLGTYRVEADFGDVAPVVRELLVVPGDGVQEVVVSRP